MDRSRLRRVSRAAWALCGLLTMAWLSLEDRGLVAVQLVAWGIAASILMSARARQSGRRPFRWWIPAAMGAGLLVAPLAALLIVTKIGVHGHPVPDFTLADLKAITWRTPAWLVVGGLAGAGLATWDGDGKTREVQ